MHWHSHQAKAIHHSPPPDRCISLPPIGKFPTGIGKTILFVWFFRIPLSHRRKQTHKSYENKGKKFMYMAMLVALTLAFPSCNVEMELGTTPWNIVNAQRISAATTGRTTGTTTTALHHFQVLRVFIPTERVKTLSAFRMPRTLGGIYLHLYVGLVRRFLHQHPVELRRRWLLLHGQYPPGRRTNGMPARRCGCMLL